MTHQAPEPGIPRPGSLETGNARRRRRLAQATLSLATALSCAVAAPAQIDTGSKGPIDITADQAEAVNAKCMAIFRGSAEAIRDTARLRADTITIYSRTKGVGADGQPSCGDWERLVADGHVYYATPDENAKGEKAVYTQADDLIVFTGDVVLVKGKDVARGDRLTIHVSTKEATLVSKVTGAGKPGRVRAVFYPDKTSTTGASTSALSTAAAPKP